MPQTHVSPSSWVSTALGKRDVLGAGGSRPCETKRKEAGRAPRMELWLELGEKNCKRSSDQWKVRSNGYSDQRGLGTACIRGLTIWEASLLSWDQSSTALFFPIQLFSEGRGEKESKAGMAYIMPKVERAGLVLACPLLRVPATYTAT